MSVCVCALRGGPDRWLGAVHPRNLTWKWIREWQRVMGGNRSTRFKRLGFCKSNPRVLPPPLLWLCSQIMNIFMASIWHHAQKDIFLPLPDRNPGVTECHTGMESVCGPRARGGDSWCTGWWHQVDVFPSWAESPPFVLLINHGAARSLLSLVASCCTERRFQSALSASCVLTNCDRFPRLISETPEWLSGGGVCSD